MISLSILIPTTPDRQYKLSLLLSQLEKQIINKPVQILVNETKSYKDQPTLQHTIGYKRNVLVRKANNEYCCFIDSDDRVSDNYIDLILNALQKKPKATHCSLLGVYSQNGIDKGIFHHSIQYKKWRTTNNKIKFERSVNHLNPVKRQIMLANPFPQIMFGEDHKQSLSMIKDLKEEAEIRQILYYYDK